MSVSREISPRGFSLTSPFVSRLAVVVVPLLFGYYSLWLGADSNWDLHNYHLYAAFAFLNGKLSTDFAAASFQGYFNPLLDAIVYWLNAHAPSRVVGFMLGAFHGLVFVLLLGIARRLLSGLPGEDGRRVPLLLALGGCLTANFLSGLGSGMGDDTTAVLCVAGVSLLIAHWDAFERVTAKGILVLLGGGMLIGLAAGFKLTNAVFAVAGCGALVLAVPGGLVTRLRVGFVFGVGVLAGFAVTGGYWMLQMWQTFGNPLFPQFSAFFPNPLVRSISIGDTRWLPRSGVETALWPFIFSIDSHRVGEVAIRQVIWPIVYTLGLIWAARAVWMKFAARAVERMDPRAVFLIAYIALGYVVWMKLFSIYRYVVPVEVLTPLAVFILLTRLMPYRRAKRWAGWLLGIATAVVVTGGASTWGHDGWADPLYHAELPALEQPSRTTVLLVNAEQPRAWLATLFPVEVAFAGIDVGFPQGPAYMSRIHEMVETRNGPVYALLGSAYNWRADQVARMDAAAGSVGLTHSERGCALLKSVTVRLRLHAAVEAVAPGDGGARCAIGLRADDVRDIAAENREIVAQADRQLQDRGLSIDVKSCAVYAAGVGTGKEPYQFCGVARR
ncbi:hypothetical protein [Burkholderia alba]|uniref:hypothetical protein n=1 Tax=Burkholderia alba TaxID=2683677 RepID=UPI002B0583E4|nr:hypothetical protein [Burkholderia alba]